MPFYSHIPIGDGAPEEVNTIVEVPKGASNKYRFDTETGNFRYDRTLYSPLFYPYDYGWICGTCDSTDNQPLNCLVIATNATFPGCLVEARPVGTLVTEDIHGEDPKILCVAIKDPRFADIRSLSDIGQHTLLEVRHFFEIYQTLEQRLVRIVGWEDTSETMQRIEAAANGAAMQ